MPQTHDISPDRATPNTDGSGPELTSKTEDYLRRIYRIEQESDSRVSNSDIAESLDVTQASVTSMLATLSDRGLLDRERYRPVRLTPDGETLALQVVRKHRLVETMLAELFEYPISDVDAEADILEHHISHRLCQAIERKLGMPDTDPHGDPIPDRNLEVTHSEEMTTLPEVSESSTVEVTRVLTQDDAALTYLVSQGIEPEVRLTLDDVTPLGMVVVTVERTGTQTSLPQRVASQILTVPDQ